MNLSLFILQGEPSMLTSLFPFIIVLFIIYFFFIRPQKKTQSKQKTFLEDLSKGDEVVTASGIIGRISKIDGSTVSIQVDQKTFINMTISAISREMTEQHLAKKDDAK